MRALAEFMMRGRLQAGAVALVGNLVPFLSPAAVGLVTLRKGIAEGLLITLWAALPAVLTAYASDFSSLVAGLSLVVLLIAVVAAETLKLTASWQQALLVITLVSALSALVMNQLFPDEMLQLDEYVARVFTELAAGAGQADDQPFIPGRVFILGIMGYMLALNAVVCLLVARWWQSQLYNPGGLRAEFHQLRLRVAPACVLLAAVMWCYFGSPEYNGWAGLVGLPLLLSAIGLVHHSVANFGMGAHWLVLFYIGLIMIGPLSVVLVGLGFLDSIMNIRSRISSAASR